MVFKLLGSSLFDYFQQVGFQPFSLRQIQSFAGQLINAVSFLHDNGMVHTDLKPENLMLENMETIQVPFSVLSIYENSKNRMRRILKDTTIWLIDFGSTVHEHDYHGSVVSTRHYRAPEIVLNMGWSFPCDMVLYFNVVVCWLYSS
jgi:dual-specificity kinase